MKFCETCFGKVTHVDVHGDCVHCSDLPLSEVKFADETDKTEWISVPSPFKAYPESEGV